MNWPKGINLLAAMMAAAATDKNLFAVPRYNSEPPYKENNSPEAKGLHKYECNGYFFYAHNDKEALKRAKKLRDEFLNNFKDLIEKLKPLYE